MSLSYSIQARNIRYKACLAFWSCYKRESLTGLQTNEKWKCCLDHYFRDSVYDSRIWFTKRYWGCNGDWQNQGHTCASWAPKFPLPDFALGRKRLASRMLKKLFSNALAVNVKNTIRATVIAQRKKYTSPARLTLLEVALDSWNCQYFRTLIAYYFTMDDRRTDKLYTPNLSRRTWILTDFAPAPLDPVYV